MGGEHKIAVVMRVLELYGREVGVESTQGMDEPTLRQKAYECMLKRDKLAAFEIRWGVPWREFTDEQWREVIRVAGEKFIWSNIGAFAACQSRGLITF
jgi:hypothetical protein